MKGDCMKKRLLIIGLLNCIVFLWASDFEKRIDAVYWLTGYYNEVIQKRDRDVILKYIPKYAAQPLIFHYELDKEFYWYEDPSLQFGLLSIMKSYISDERFINIQEYIFTLLKIKKIEENFYEIIVEKKYLNKNAIESAVFRGGNLSKAYNREINTLYFKFDGDYLYIYLEDKKTLLTTYYAYDETEYKCLKNAIKTNQFNMNDYTMPRHADGSCDYETVVRLQSGKGYRASDNLRLRSSGSKAGKPVVTIGKGTQVKVLGIGAEQTIDGITSNWVQVEVQAGAKDKDGKAIAAGTTGWCFGGYLTER